MSQEAQHVGNIAATIVNRWKWWQDALTGKFGPIHHEPEQGYFRVRKKGEPWEPVAIWFDAERDEWLAYRSGREVRAEDIWMWACRNPITHEAYEKAMAGDGFDDEPRTAPGIGDNSGEADPFDALTIEYLGEKEMAEEFMKTPVETQDQSDKVAIWCDRILKIRSKAQALHKAEKQPFLDGGKAVDNKWRGLAHDKDGETTELIAKLRAHNMSFLKKKAREEEERQRKAREDAERIRREAAEAARKAQESDQQSEKDREAAAKEADRLAAQARQAEQEAEARRVNSGRTGSKMGLRVEKKGEITDYDMFVMAVRNRDEVKELMQSLANRAAKSGFQVDGMKIVEIEKVV